MAEPSIPPGFDFTDPDLTRVPMDEFAELRRCFIHETLVGFAWNDGGAALATAQDRFAFPQIQTGHLG